MKLNALLLIPLILFLTQMVHSTRYQHIGSCYYFDGSFADCNLTLVCDQEPSFHDIFTDDVKTVCKNQHLYEEYEDGFRKRMYFHISV